MELSCEKEKEEALKKKSESALGWPDLLAALAERAAGEPGKKLCLNPPVFTSVGACRAALDETEEMIGFLLRGEMVPGAAIEDCAKAVETAAAGGVLPGEDLLKIRQQLRAVASMRAFLADSPHARRLREHAEQLHELPELRRLLERSLEPDGSLSDDASETLRALRRQRRLLNERIHRRLAEIVANNPDSVLQDSFYTQRGQRYVVPVKAAARQNFPGIVHDASASGQTVFVEPAELVEPNNRLKLLEAEIEAEILRVLRALSASVAAVAPFLLANQRLLAHLDFVTARARLAVELKAARPGINDQGRIALKTARHPLLVLRGVRVVGSDLELSAETPVLVVSGPNAGGKTVALTMLGLFTLMIRCGMFIPADPDSEMALFASVFAVIGDEQDLSRDLSSFAAHLTDLNAIIAQNGKGSLVLLDELMSSTDPEEGAALAMALLIFLRDRGAEVMVTTHLPALKALAHEEPGFQNASFTFDPDSLAPTYRLCLGLPGRSMGLEMAARLGLPTELIDAARARLSPTAVNMESLLAALADRLHRLDEEAAALEALKAEAAARREEYERLREEVRRRQAELRREAAERVRDVVRRAELEAENILADLRRQERRAEDAAAAKRKLSQLADQLQAEAGGVAEEGEELDWSAVRPGDRVKVMPLGIEAELVSLPEGKINPQSSILVKMGKMKFSVEAAKIRALPRPAAGGEDKFSLLRRSKPKKKEKPPREGREVSFVPAAAPEGEPGGAVLPPTRANTLDLRGLRVHEAEARLEQFLDHAACRSLPNIFVIHGHGTGALKQMVRELLAASPYVARFRPGERGEGGDGVTMVELKIQVS